jgi:SAM-dependent methyltransferase
MKRDPFCRSEQNLAQRLEQWTEELPGRYLLEQEMAVLERLLPDLFGYYLLQLGLGKSLDRIGQFSRIKTHILLEQAGTQFSVPTAIRADYLRLPIATDSVDVVFLPHVLDFVADPHQLLREAERILIPEGRLIVFGLNPWGLWGLWKLVLGRSGKLPWCGQFVSQRRLNDWLSLLGFEVELSEPLMFRPPLGNEAVMSHLEFLERLGRRFWPALSNGYVVQAVRRVSNLTPVEPGWKKKAAVFSGGMVEPSTRSGGV